MTHPDKLSIKEVEEWVDYWQHPGWENEYQIAKQLIDLMLENEKLQSCLKAFYFDTMYKDNPELHDLACGLLAPYDEDFAEVKRNKDLEASSTSNVTTSRHDADCPLMQSPHDKTCTCANQTKT